jgi:hypothetical protein
LLQLKGRIKLQIREKGVWSDSISKIQKTMCLLWKKKKKKKTQSPSRRKKKLLNIKKNFPLSLSRK